MDSYILASIMVPIPYLIHVVHFLLQSTKTNNIFMYLFVLFLIEWFLFL